MNFAGVKKLPVIFVVENNEYAISVPIEEQYANKRMADRAKAYGFEGVTVDGSDFAEVYLAFKEAVKAARGKKGPKLIELMVSRLTSHSADDDQSVYRSKEEIEEKLKINENISFGENIGFHEISNNEGNINIHQIHNN